MYGEGSLQVCASSNTSLLLSCIGGRVQCGGLPPGETEECIGHQAKRLDAYLTSQDGPSTRLFQAQVVTSYSCLVIELLLAIGCFVVHAIAAARRYGSPHLFASTTLARMAGSRLACLRRFAGVPVRQWVG